MLHKRFDTSAFLGMMCVAFMLTACSIFGGADNDYTKSTSLPPLEVPPDLTKPDWNTRMSIPENESGTVSAVETSRRQEEFHSRENSTAPAVDKTEILPAFEGIEVRRESNVRWLEIAASTDALWPRLKAFWKQAGIELEKEDPTVGVMETVWYEQREPLPKGSFGKLMGRAYNVFSDTGLRDKYRVRIERVSQEFTNVYLTQRRAEQVGDVSDDETFVRWKLRAPSPELEAEMLTRLMVFLGTDKDEAQKQLAASRTPAVIPMDLKTVDGKPALFVTGEFSGVWRRTGVALDRAGLFVEQQDESKGVYLVTYTAAEGEKKRGFFSRLFGAGNGLEINEIYQIHLLKQDGQTRITAYSNGEDDTPEELKPKAAEVILERLKKAYQIGGNSA
jgi:outer membrane protein assembly factor BamC